MNKILIVLVAMASVLSGCASVSRTEADKLLENHGLISLCPPIHDGICGQGLSIEQLDGDLGGALMRRDKVFVLPGLHSVTVVNAQGRQEMSVEIDAGNWYPLGFYGPTQPWTKIWGTWQFGTKKSLVTLNEQVAKGWNIQQVPVFLYDLIIADCKEIQKKGNRKTITAKLLGVADESRIEADRGGYVQMPPEQLFYAVMKKYNGPQPMTVNESYKFFKLSTGGTVD